MRSNAQLLGNLDGGSLARISFDVQRADRIRGPSRHSFMERHLGGLLDNSTVLKTSNVISKKVAVSMLRLIEIVGILNLGFLEISASNVSVSRAFTGN